MELEAIRDELIQVAKVVEHHKEVADTVGISVPFLTQIRQGKNCTTDKPENRKLLQKLIDTYRKIGRNKIKNLTEVVIKN